MTPDDFFSTMLKALRALREHDIVPSSISMTKDQLDRLKAYCSTHGYTPVAIDGPSQYSIFGIKIVVVED